MGTSLKLSNELKLAKKDLRSGDLAVAKKRYMSILKKFPGNKEAINAIKKLNQFNPTTSHEQKLIRLFYEKDAGDFLPIVKNLLKNNSESAFLTHLLALTYMKLNQFDSSKENFIHAIQLEPNNPEYYNNFGILLRDNNEIRNSIEYFLNAITLHPKYDDAYNNLGIAYNKVKKVDEAVAAITQATSINPRNEKALMNLSKILLEIKDYHQAKKYAYSLLTLDHTNRLAMEILKNCYVETDDMKGAKNAFFDIIKRNHENVPAWLTMCQLFQEIGKIEEAIALMNSAMTSMPHVIDFKIKFADLHLECRQFETAILAYQDAKQLDQNNELIYHNLGVALINAGKISSAIKHYKNLPNYMGPSLVNASSLAVQLHNSLVPEDLRTQIQRQHRSYILDVNYFIHRLIDRLIDGEYQSMQQMICESRLSLEAQEEKLPEEEKKFYRGYFDFLEPLSKTLKNSRNQAIQPAYHIGESHSLSFANEIISTHTNTYQIKPMITFGAKAFHFTTDYQNKFKAITRLNFNAIPDGSTVFLSFGEIDCRHDEGFIKHAHNFSNLQELIGCIVEKFVHWFTKLNQIKNHKLFFFLVPAPIYREDFTHQTNILTSNIVRVYNLNLIKLCENHDLGYIDTYVHTNNGSGFSNQKHHIDEFHLSPSVLNELIFNI